LNLYNDNDPAVCAWVENLVAAGRIPPGDVICKSITEISPDDCRGYTQCHFFCGIAGWTVALALAGWPIDKPVWTGSCPCQPFSTAGLGKGADDERHLWPAFHSLIRECQPATVFGEQVASSDGRLWLTAVDLTWKHWDMPLGLPICALRASVRRTSASDFSGWPTPLTNDSPYSYGPGRRKILKLAGVAQLTGWSTPRACDSGRTDALTMARFNMKTSRRNLIGDAGMAGWATPRAHDGRKGTRTLLGAENEAKRKGWNNELGVAAFGTISNGSVAEMGKPGQLNPELARWLMGYPAGWSSYAVTGMRSTRTKRRRS
jgi:DNA (cytosine-5)-methyltransferase 1